MSSLVQEIEARIADARVITVRQNVGVIREIGDGVARVEGLTDVMLNEMLDLGHGITGLALSLDETDVGVVILGDDTQLEEGDEVRATGKLLQVPVGKGLLGRVMNMLGEPLDGKGPIASDVAYPVEKIAPGIMRRRPISQPVQTGIMAIDAMIPIGRGQRELIIGDRSTGKTTICIDTIISQARLNAAAGAAGDQTYRPLYCIYVAIGQKQSTIARIISTLEEAGAMPYTIVVAAPAADSATSQYLAPFAGAAMGEWFMDNGMDALIVYDDLSKHAVAYRQVSLVLKRPSGRRASQGRPGAVPRARGVRAVRLGARRGDAGEDRPRETHHRAVQSAAARPDSGRGAGGPAVDRAKRIRGRDPRRPHQGLSDQADRVPDVVESQSTREDRTRRSAQRPAIGRAESGCGS